MSDEDFDAVRRRFVQKRMVAVMKQAAPQGAQHQADMQGQDLTDLSFVAAQVAQHQADMQGQQDLAAQLQLATQQLALQQQVELQQAAQLEELRIAAEAATQQQEILNQQFHQQAAEEVVRGIETSQMSVADALNAHVTGAVGMLPTYGMGPFPNLDTSMHAGGWRRSGGKGNTPQCDRKPAITSQRIYTGVLKSFDEYKRCGFIECDEIRQLSGGAVYCFQDVLTRAQAGVGDCLSFAIHVSARGKMQAGSPLVRIATANGYARQGNFTLGGRAEDPESGGTLDCFDIKRVFGRGVRVPKEIAKKLNFGRRAAFNCVVDPEGIVRCYDAIPCSEEWNPETNPLQSITLPGFDPGYTSTPGAPAGASIGGIAVAGGGAFMDWGFENNAAWTREIPTLKQADQGPPAVEMVSEMMQPDDNLLNNVEVSEAFKSLAADGQTPWGRAFMAAAASGSMDDDEDPAAKRPKNG